MSSVVCKVVGDECIRRNHSLKVIEVSLLSFQESESDAVSIKSETPVRAGAAAAAAEREVRALRHRSLSPTLSGAVSRGSPRSRGRGRRSVLPRAEPLLPNIAEERPTTTVTTTTRSFY